MQLKSVTVEEFCQVWDRVDLCMRRSAQRHGYQMYKDYDVYEPYNGWSQVLLEIFNLDVLTGRLVAKLRRQVKDRPGWEIVVAIAVDEYWDAWPRMGIRIRAHEIVDDLQRDFFPLKYRTLTFEGARPGTDSDR